MQVVWINYKYKTVFHTPSSSRSDRVSCSRSALMQDARCKTQDAHGPARETHMFFFDEGFTFRNFLVDVFTIFVFVFWFWLVITVALDLFRRHDISGWGKAIWVIAWVVFPLIAVLAYLIFQGRGMADRNVQRAEEAREELRRVV